MLTCCAHSFDLIAAVGYSVWVLAYCYTNFDFDRRAFELNLKLLLPGSFERMGRLQTNATETTLFRACFDSLGFQSFGTLFIRVGMNLTLCHRFHAVINALLDEQRPVHQVAAVLPASPATLSKSLQPQRRVPRPFAAAFVAFAAVVILCTEKAMETSRAVCAAHPQCVVFAYRWRDSSSCPCLALIDVDRTPRTLDEWMHPVDATPTLQALAASGDLRVLHVINRELLQLPDELRQCHGLEYL